MPIQEETSEMISSILTPPSDPIMVSFVISSSKKRQRSKSSLSSGNKRYEKSGSKEKPKAIKTSEMLLQDIAKLDEQIKIKNQEIAKMDTILEQD